MTTSRPVEEASITTGAPEAPCARAGHSCTHPPTTPARTPARGQSAPRTQSLPQTTQEQLGYHASDPRQHKPSPSPAARLHQENATQEAQPGYDHKPRAVPSRENVSRESPDAQARTTPTTVGIFNLLTYLSQTWSASWMDTLRHRCQVTRIKSHSLKLKHSKPCYVSDRDIKSAPLQTNWRHSD